jgi:hypothetical protein
MSQRENAGARTNKTAQKTLPQRAHEQNTSPSARTSKKKTITSARTSTM